MTLRDPIPKVHQNQWPVRRLGDLAEILDHLRIPINSEERDKRLGDVPYYGANGIQGYIDEHLFNEPLVLLAEDGGNFDDFASRPIAYRVDGPSWVNNHAHILRPSDASTILGFLFHALEHRDIRRYISGGTRGKLTQAELRSIEVLTPPTAEQASIAEVLDNLDEAIRESEVVNRKRRVCLDGLCRDLMTFGLTEGGAIRTPHLFPDEFESSLGGRTPKTWRVGPLGNFISLQRGFDITQQEQRDGIVPVVSSSGITSYHDTAMVQGPGVVIGRKGKLGGAYYLETPFWPHDTSLWVKDFHGNDPEFCAHFLRHLRLERFDAATSVPTLNRNFVHPILVAFPAREEQERICNIIRAATADLDRETELVGKLKSLKSGLASDLLTGRVRTPPR
jgi:type I restriction enzyme S subunit